MIILVWESSKLNVAYPKKALIIVHLQVADLLFDEPNQKEKGNYSGKNKSARR